MVSYPLIKEGQLSHKCTIASPVESMNLLSKGSNESLPNIDPPYRKMVSYPHVLYYWASLESDCQGNLCWLIILSPRTAPNVSAYRPDSDSNSDRCLGRSSNRSHLSKDSQDGPLIMALGNGPKQD